MYLKDDENDRGYWECTTNPDNIEDEEEREAYINAMNDFYFDWYCDNSLLLTTGAATVLSAIGVIQLL